MPKRGADQGAFSDKKAEEKSESEAALVALETLQNLFYLIEQDAGNSERVRHYTLMSKESLEVLKRILDQPHPAKSR